MHWRVANEQQPEARWRVFLMFVVMALLVIRTGLVSRGIIAVPCTQNASQGGAPPITGQPSSASPANLPKATLVLLCLAQAAGRLLIVKERAVWELIDQPLFQPPQGQLLSAASLCERPQRLDTS